MILFFLNIKIVESLNLIEVFYRNFKCFNESYFVVLGIWFFFWLKVIEVVIWSVFCYLNGYKGDWILRIILKKNFLNFNVWLS